MVGPFPDPVTSTLWCGTQTLQHSSATNGHLFYIQSAFFDRFPIITGFPVVDRGEKQLFHPDCHFLICILQDVKCVFYLLAPDQIHYQPHFTRGRRAIVQSGSRSSSYLSFFLLFTLLYNDRLLQFSCCFHYLLFFLFSMASECARGRKLTKLMTYHIFRYIHRDKLIPIVDGEGMTNKIRRDYRSSRPGLDN